MNKRVVIGLVLVLLMIVVVLISSVMVQNTDDNLTIYNMISNFSDTNTTINGMLNEFLVSTANTTSVSPLDVVISSPLNFINDSIQFPETISNVSSFVERPFPIVNITTTITYVSGFIDGVTVNPNNFTFCLKKNMYLYEPFILTNNLSIPAQYTLNTIVDSDITGINISFVYFMDDGAQLNISGAMWIKSETSHLVFMTIETDDSFKQGVYHVDIIVQWSAVGKIN